MAVDAGLELGIEDSRMINTQYLQGLRDRAGRYTRLSMVREDRRFGAMISDRDGSHASYPTGQKGGEFVQYIERPPFTTGVQVTDVAMGYQRAGLLISREPMKLGLREAASSLKSHHDRTGHWANGIGNEPSHIPAVT